MKSGVFAWDNLCQAGGAERVALGDESAAGIHHVLAAIGHVARLDQLATLACGKQGFERWQAGPRFLQHQSFIHSFVHSSSRTGLAEAEALVGDELVGGEAVVQLNDIHIRRANLGLRVRLRGRPPRHVRPWGHKTRRKKKKKGKKEKRKKRKKENKKKKKKGPKTGERKITD